MQLPGSARRVTEGGSLAHLVPLDADGSPQVTCVWVGLDEGEIAVRIGRPPIARACPTLLRSTR